MTQTDDSPLKGSPIYEQERGKQELQSFQSIWQGGYFEGNPLDPMGPSTYGNTGYMSILHATYLLCIKPYVNKETVALEIGPGRGAWTKALLSAKEVWCLDALSAEHNGFWEYLNRPTNVKYFQVSDYTCSMLPDDTFTYVFSFGCLCHIAFESVTAYMTNMYPKLKKGARGFIMIADYDKYNAYLDQWQRLNVGRAFDNGTAYLPTRLMWNTSIQLWRRLNGTGASKTAHQRLDKNEDATPREGRWYHSGVDRTCTMLESLGYTVIDPDVGTNHRDPIIHFVK
jgi:hypothetical protein